MSVASTKRQFIVELKKVWHPNILPASHQAGSDLTVIFGSLRFNVNPMAEYIHYIECVELAIAFYVTRAD